MKTTLTFILSFMVCMIHAGAQTRIDVGVQNFSEDPSGTVHFDLTMECTRSDTAFVAFGDIVFTADWDQFTNPTLSVSNLGNAKSRSGNKNLNPGFIRFGIQNNSEKVIYTFDPKFIDSQMQFNDNVMALDNGKIYATVHIEIDGYTGMGDPGLEWVTSGERNESTTHIYTFASRTPKFTSEEAEVRLIAFPSLGSPRLNLTVFLEGAYNPGTGQMNTTLNDNDLLPLKNPYGVAPWNYTGGDSVESIPNANVVDWVLVEIRESYNPANASGSTSIGKRAAFLLKDGSIVDMDGSSYLEFDNTEFHSDKKQFVVIYHRNHLAIMSADSLTFNDSLPPIDRWEYDFTTDLAVAYGGANGAKMKSSVVMMMAGDADGTGQISAGDQNLYWQPNNGMLGVYSNADFNMDGQISAGDSNLLWQVNNGKITAKP